MKIKHRHYTADRIGITASTLCAIHCALVPVLLTALPLTGLQFLANPWLEWSMILFALLIGIFAIGRSYFIRHHKPFPLIMLITGFGVILLGHLLAQGWLEAVIVPAGGLIIAVAHYLNARYIGACATGKHDLGFHHQHNSYNQPNQHLSIK